MSIEMRADLVDTSTDPKSEAVVYMVTQAGGCATWLYVLTREDAIKFCSHPSTKGKGRGGEWLFMWTTAFTDWRDHTKEFRRKDDGRFDKLFEELGIEPIYKNT